MEIYFDAMVNGLPLLFVVYVLVELIKRLEDNSGNPLVKGNALLASSFAIGVVLGMLYSVSAVEPPTGDGTYHQFVYWFGVVIYGLGLGGGATVIYDSIKALVVKQTERALEEREP